jgi:transposase-like protein
MVPKVRQGGYITFFGVEAQAQWSSLDPAVQETFAQWGSTRKMEKLAHSLGIENLSRSQGGEMTKGLNKQVPEFRSRFLAGAIYPVLWADELCKKVRANGIIASMAILVVCGVDEHGHREVLAVESMAEESRDSYLLFFQSLKARGPATPQLMISDASVGLIGHCLRRAFREYPGSAARYISCAIFWHISRRETRSRLRQN